MRRHVLLLLTVAGAGLLGPAALADTVERRGGLPALSGEVIGVDDDGVTIKSPDLGARHFIPWDRVRDVRTDTADPTIPRRLETATDLWRARSRVERGDYALAEPLLERHFTRTRGRDGETPLVVAEGLLRCRLARGASVAAVIPWLEVTRLRRDGMTTASYAELPSVRDEATDLCPQLAPAWVQSRALLKLERDLAAFDARGDEVVRQLAAVYRRSARRHLGMGPAERAGDAAEPRHSGVRLVNELLATTDDDPAARDAARARLRASIDGSPPWREAWIRFALGTSLLHETGTGRRQRGRVELVHLPVRFSGQVPYLAGLAGGWIVEASRADGDEQAAAVMQRELTRHFPDHPVMTMSDPVRLPPVERSLP